jgi:hypothetical protein
VSGHAGAGWHCLTYLLDDAGETFEWVNLEALSGEELMEDASFPITRLLAPAAEAVRAAALPDGVYAIQVGCGSTQLRAAECAAASQSRDPRRAAGRRWAAAETAARPS